ncbi:MAG: D-TA family PLP-dependent enzyme [Thermonemataceae bacterium]
MAWFDIKNIATVDSPSVVVYKERFVKNIQLALQMVGGEAHRLIPHIKTNKMQEVVEAMVVQGIKKVKVSTLAEAELAALSGMSSVLVAHQLVGPKVARFFTLIQTFPQVTFSTIVDDRQIATLLNEQAEKAGIKVEVYIDINNGMNRSGIQLGAVLDQLITQLTNCEHLQLKGLHIYDGHHRDKDFTTRKQKIETDFAPVQALYEQLKVSYPTLTLIVGGTPAFTTHLQHQERICSPGTFVFWDVNYAEALTEQQFHWAALVVHRVISKPSEGIITTDLGHKAIAAEQPIDQRVRLLNPKGAYKLIKQSEEHGVWQVEHWEDYQVGDVLYGVPYHICPTIHLYEEVAVIENHQKVDTWQVKARGRKISV